MEYTVDPAALSAVFTVPTELVDRALKLARGEHVKVLLYVLRHTADEPTYEEIAQAADLSLYEVKEAIVYWEAAGFLCKKERSAEPDPAGKRVVRRWEKPTRADVARRGAEDERLRYLLQETQMKMGRNLKTNETSTLVWLYDDAGMEISVILMIVQYAVAHDKANIRFIESTAVDWIDRGINTVADADEELRRMAMEEGAWKVVQSAFGMDRRKPSKKERGLAVQWVCEWKLSKELLTAAYDACVDAKSSFSFPYTAKILERWHEQGVETVEETAAASTQTKPGDYAAYDLDLFESMLKNK